MSELSYKELQEQGVFDVPYRAFEFMQSQQGEVDKLQTEIDELQARIDDASNKIDFWVSGKNGDAIHVAKSIGNILKGNKDEN